MDADAWNIPKHLVRCVKGVSPLPWCCDIKDCTRRLLQESSTDCLRSSFGQSKKDKEFRVDSAALYTDFATSHKNMVNSATFRARPALCLVWETQHPQPVPSSKQLFFPIGFEVGH